MVDVEAWVDEGDGVEDVVPEIALVGLVVGSWGVGEGAGGWIDEVLVEEVGVAARVRGGVDVIGE